MNGTPAERWRHLRGSVSEKWRHLRGVLSEKWGPVRDVLSARWRHLLGEALASTQAVVGRLGRRTLIVLAVNAAATVPIAWFLLARTFDPPAVSVETALSPAPAEKAGAPRPPASLKSFRDRPLFASNRRAATPEEIAAAEAAAAVPPPPPALTGYRLTGTMIGAGKKLAFVQPDGSGKATSIPVGGDVEGWQLVELDTRTATFELQGNRTVLSLALVSGGGPGGGRAAEETGTGALSGEEKATRKNDGPGKSSPARLYRPPKRH